MAVNHETGSAGRSEIGKLGASTFIFGVTTVSLLAGFGIALGRVKRKSPTEFNEIAANKLARKALGYGTLLSISGCGLLGLAVRWALGAKNVSFDYLEHCKLNYLLFVVLALMKNSQC